MSPQATLVSSEPWDRSRARPFVLAILYTLVLLLFPWGDFATGKFTDTERYLSSLQELLSAPPGEVEGLGYIQEVLSEPLWRYLLLAIGWAFDEPIRGLLIVSAFCGFVYALFLYRHVNQVIASFVLLNPLVLDLIMSQTRSALALAFCLLALMARRRSLALLCVALAILTHTATFLLLAMYLASRSVDRLLPPQLGGLAAILLALTTAVVFSYGRQTVLGALGDRRAEYGDETNTLLFVMYWMILAGAMMFTGFRDDRAPRWWNYFSVTMLATPFLLTAFGINGIRLIALCLPVAIPALCARPSPTRELLVSSLALYQLVQYAYWF